MRNPLNRAAAVPRPGAFFGLPLVLAVFLISFALHAPSLQNGFIEWDDPRYVVENPVIRSFSMENMKEAWSISVVGIYAPLNLLSYAVDYAFWGLDPIGYHLSNVILHALSSGLFALILLRLGMAWPAAGFGAVLLALHPVQVEPVAWISQRKAVLSMVFLLLSFLVYVRATRITPASRVGVLGAFLLFLAALFSKVTVVIFPCVLFLYDLGHRSESRLYLLIEKLPFFFASAVLALIGYRLQASGGVTIEGWLGGTPILHAATIAELLARNLRLLLFPTQLSALYAPEDARSAMEPWAVAGYALLVAGAIGVLWAWRRRRSALVWMGFFWFGLLPTAQIVPYALRMADRYLYIPSLGVFAGLGFGVSALWKRLNPGVARRLFVLAPGLIIFCMASLSLAREGVWRDSRALWADTVRKAPVHWMAYNNYAKALMDDGDWQGAIDNYRLALEKNPESLWSLVNLGNIHARRGNKRQAELLYRRALRLESVDPAVRATVARNLEVLLSGRERYE